MDVPFLNYIGYRVMDLYTGEVLDISDGENAEVRVTIPENYKGTIEEKYVGMWYWKIADDVSLLALAGIMSLSICRKRQNRLAHCLLMK